MRINKFVAQATGLSRRAADTAIQEGRVTLNQHPAKLGDDVGDNDNVMLDDKAVAITANTTTIMFNKPVGYVCSREGQGSQTIYELLPNEYHSLKPAGRLDKDSSGLLILTNDGDLAQELTHPRYVKTKIYEIYLDKPLEPLHQQMISDHGIQLDDGPSKLALSKLGDDGQKWQVTMHEGRNRQIRRTFSALGYDVTRLNRIAVGPYNLGDLKAAQFRQL